MWLTKIVFFKLSLRTALREIMKIYLSWCIFQFFMSFNISIYLSKNRPIFNVDFLELLHDYANYYLLYTEYI